MPHFHLLTIKASKLSRFETLWFLTSIVLLISSMMCLAVATMALVLPVVNMVMVWLALASLSLGLVGYISIKILHKRHNTHQCYT